MAVLRLNATEDGALLAHRSQGAWTTALDTALDALPPTGVRITVLVHGYRFTWRPCADGSTPYCPQETLYDTVEIPRRKAVWPCHANWPASLGLLGERAGLVIGFGWDGRRRPFRTLVATGRNDFAVVYEAAAVAGSALARMLGRIAERRPDLRVDILAHSLGARVALAAVAERPDLSLGRNLLLGAAEYAGVARAALTAQAEAGGSGSFYHAYSRANDLFDGLFNLLAPRSPEPADRSLGVAGLQPLGATASRWIDLQLDAPATAQILAMRGFACERMNEAISHWHFYTDPGALGAWRAILERQPGWDIAQLRAAGLDAAPLPRWSRLMPRPMPRLAGLRPSLPRRGAAATLNSAS
ncbi:MAG: hypothetical protein AAF416_05745 [Pseudomonadota bacterium]